MAGTKVKSVQETLIYMISTLGEALTLYGLYIGIADGMSVARVSACRYSK